MAKRVKSDDNVAYLVSRSSEDDALINKALQALERRMRVKDGTVMGSPLATQQYLRLRFANLEHEVFAILHLDNRHALIECQELFRGTIDGASVYPREVVKEVLSRNTASVILVHNHPSGNPEPSQADQFITKRLKEALALIDVRVLDHLIVTPTTSTSFAERGLL